MTFVSKRQDISYAVDAEIVYSPRQTSADVQYDFPFTRHADPLSLIEQCHAILRARTLTQPATFATKENARRDGNRDAAEATETRRKLITLEAIMNYVQEGVEWKPLNSHNQSTDKAHFSRKEIVRVINDYAHHMPLNILYDSRFVAYDSHFCPSDTPEPPPRPQPLKMRKPHATHIHMCKYRHLHVHTHIRKHTHAHIHI